MPSEFCPSCGNGYLQDARFCPSCGQRLPRGQEAVGASGPHSRQCPPNSKFGVASFVLSILAVATFFILAIASGYWYQQAIGESSGKSIEPPLFAILVWGVATAVSLTALALGIMARTDRLTNRFHAHWGTTVSAVAIAVALVYGITTLLVAIT